MGNSANQLDRLLPRHESPGSINVDWHVHMARDGLFKKAEVCTPAVMRDISLEGALVEVDSATRHEVGDRITVRLEGHEGIAVIRHAREGDDSAMLYGVRFLRDEGFNDAIDLTVGKLRGHSAELATAWQRQN